MDFNLNTAGLGADDKLVPFSETEIYDVLIIGGGPAGMTAAVYCMRKGVSTGIIFKEAGGQMAETWDIENYMGYRYISAPELIEKFREQVAQFNIAYEEGGEAVSVAQGDVHVVTLGDGRKLRAKALIIATGEFPRRLGVPGEREFSGKGVAYCSVCDAPLYAGKTVIVAGGGNSAMVAALDVAKVATKVTVVHHSAKFKSDRVLLDSFNKLGNASALFEHEVREVKGAGKVNAVVVEDKKSGEVKEFPADGIFVQIGLVPNSNLVKGVLALNEAGEIIVDSSCATNVPGIFAAGDVTSVKYKQIIIAAGEGAKAALAACDYIMKRG